MEPLIPLWAIQAAAAPAIIGYMIGEGLSVTGEQLSHFLSRPGLFVRSILAALVLVPLCAVILVEWISVPQQVAIAVILMAISPAPPMGLQRLKNTSDDHGYAISMQVSLCLLAIVSVPGTLALLSMVFKSHANLPPNEVARTVMATQIVPLAAGFALRRYAPRAAEKARPWLMRAPRLLLPVAVVFILIDTGSRLLDIGWPGTAMVVTLTVVALGIGYWLGGPLLALTSAARYPGLALMIALRNFPNQGVGVMIISYMLVSVATILVLHRLVILRLARRGT